VVIKRENLIAYDEAKEVSEALADPARYKLIVAPTGSGKTHSIVTCIAPYLDSASANSYKFAVICSSKDQMEQVAKRFAVILESNNINKQGIDLIEASESLRVDDAVSRNSVREGTR
jgi:superfamily II DNA or RNA helicase